MPDAPAATPLVVWVLSIIVLALLAACTFLFGFAWRRLTKRPEEVLGAAKSGIASLEKKILHELADQAGQLAEHASTAAATAREQREATAALTKEVAQFRADLRVHDANLQTLAKRQQEHGRWLDGLANAVQQNREDIQMTTGAVGVLQDEAGKTPLPQKMPQRPRVPRGRSAIPLPPPPEDDDEGGGR